MIMMMMGHMVHKAADRSYYCKVGHFCENLIFANICEFVVSRK